MIHRHTLLHVVASYDRGFMKKERGRNGEKEGERNEGRGKERERERQADS